MSKGFQLIDREFMLASLQLKVEKLLETKVGKVGTFGRIHLLHLFKVFSFSFHFFLVQVPNFYNMEKPNGFSIVNVVQSFAKRLKMYQVGSIKVP